GSPELAVTGRREVAVAVSSSRPCVGMVMWRRRVTRRRRSALRPKERVMSVKQPSTSGALAGDGGLVQRVEWRVGAGVEQTASAPARLAPLRRAVEALDALGVRAHELPAASADGAMSYGLAIPVGDADPPDGNGADQLETFAAP